MAEATPWRGQATVLGPVHSQGSKTLGYRKKRDRCRGCGAGLEIREAYLRDDDSRLKYWRNLIRTAMRAQAPPSGPLEGAAAVSVVIGVLRPLDHHKGRDRAKPLREGVPDLPPAGRDVDKVLRAVFDAGSGVWWVDDQRIAWVLCERVYNPREGIMVRAWAARKTEEQE
jgi:Holliday junction resolvase RusA-like endonuclease